MTRHISHACTLALHAMVLLAKHRGKFHTTYRLASELTVSPHHMAKVMQGLARHGMILSRRGTKGGFLLASAPTKITLLDIYSSIEGKPAPAKCMFGAARCSQSKCILGSALEMGDKLILACLRRTSLAVAARRFSLRARRKEPGGYNRLRSAG